MLDENKRLIFLNQIGENSDTYEYHAYKYDSYDGNKDKYATTNVENILTVLNQMHFYPPECQDYTVLQLQGTSTADAIACSTSILDAIGPFSSDSMSPLMSTKAAFDYSTYPWLIKNVPEKFSSEILLVFLNDFVDNALVKHSIDIVRRRVGLNKCLIEEYSKSEALSALTHTYKQDQAGIQCMSTNEASYEFEQETIDDYKDRKGSYLTDDNVKIIKKNSNSQNIKKDIESIDSVTRIKDITPEYKECGQFLYMDVGRWGGDKDTGDAWTRRRNFGLVCGSGVMLCNYDGHKGSSISKEPNLENIYPEIWQHPDIQKMKPLLQKLSESDS